MTKNLVNKRNEIIVAQKLLKTSKEKFLKKRRMKSDKTAKSFKFLPVGLKIFSDYKNIGKNVIPFVICSICHIGIRDGTVA